MTYSNGKYFYRHYICSLCHVTLCQELSLLPWLLAHYFQMCMRNQSEIIHVHSMNNLWLNLAKVSIMNIMSYFNVLTN